MFNLRGYPLNMAEYRVTYNNGEVRFGEAIDLFSMVALIGGKEALYRVERIDVKNVETSEWVETGVFEFGVSPSARWTYEEVD